MSTLPEAHTTAPDAMAILVQQKQPEETLPPEMDSGLPKSASRVDLITGGSHPAPPQLLFNGNSAQASHHSHQSGCGTSIFGSIPTTQRLSQGIWTSCTLTKPRDIFHVQTESIKLHLSSDFVPLAPSQTQALPEQVHYQVWAKWVDSQETLNQVRAFQTAVDLEEMAAGSHCLIEGEALLVSKGKQSIITKYTDEDSSPGRDGEQLRLADRNWSCKEGERSRE